jgi:hypothetical protein
MGEQTMKIDTYRSSKMPSYEVVVPAGTDLMTLQGEAGAAVANLSPLTVRSKGAMLGDVFKGDLLTHLEAQIAAEGAGLVKTQVQFGEVVGD